MDTIKLKPIKGLQKPNSEPPRELVMAQFMLKLLTILTNILLTNLIALGQKDANLGDLVSLYVTELVKCLRQRHCQDIKLKL